MEGAGEGMVAILQGTKHAGLRVTLLPDNRLRTKRKCVLMDLGVRPPTRVTQSSVETNTERVFRNASEPLCDVSYAAGYQFANCKAVQSSYHVAEFPHRTFFKQSDKFEDSLRKYPIQASSEILQRIINYSNIRENSRKQNLRSIKSLLRKSTSQLMNRRYDSGVKTNNEIHEKRPLKKTVSTVGSKYSSHKELLSYAYDYLKCMYLIPKSTDVRYLTQVKRCIRNRLLDIIDDRPAICPKMRSRYSHHKRYFHGSVGNPTLTSNENKTIESCETTKCTHVTCRHPLNSRQKSIFVHQPKCICPPRLNKQDKTNPLESLMKKLYPELNDNKKTIPSKQIVFEPKIQMNEDFKIDPHDGVDEKILTAISEWIKSIPVYPNFSADDKIKQEQLAFKLAQNLSSLKNHVDFISKAKKEIMLCINELPMWYPPYSNDKEQFVDQIVADLLKRLVNVLEDELRYKVAKAISNLSYTEKVDIENIVDDFVNKIKTIVLHPSEDERDCMQALKARILDLFNKLPIQSSIQKMNEVADKLVNQLLELPSNKSLDEELITVEENSFREKILKWCENEPELEDIDFSKNMGLIDKLANKLKYYESREPNDKSLQTDLVKVIRRWLEDVANSENLHLNSEIKNRLSNEIANDFFGKDYNNSLNKSQSSDISSSQEALEPLLKWYYGIQELADGERAETRKAIDKLAKELNVIQSRVHNFENMLTDMKEVVTIWLQNMLKSRGKHLDSKVFDNFVNQLISELNVVPKGKKRLSGEYAQFYRDIVTWIKDIPYLMPESHLNQNKLIEKLVKKLNNLRKGSDIEPTFIKAVTKFVETLSESLRVRINEEDKQILKDKLFERLKHKLIQRKRWEKVNDLCQSMLTEFSNILQTYSNILDDTQINNINNKFCTKIIENVEENGKPNWNYLLRQLENIFIQETNLTKHEYENLANSILTRLKKMFHQETTRRPTILSQTVEDYNEPTNTIEHKLNARKKQTTQKYSNDSGSASAKSKRKRCRKINPQAGDGGKSRKRSTMSTIYKSSNSDLDTHDSVDYNDNSYEVSDIQNDYSARDKHEEFKTSTPRKAAIKKISTDLDVSTIENLTEDAQKTLLPDSGLSKQPQYLMELKNIIMNWIKSIDQSSNNHDLDSIVDTIASDIIDRQKYLQLSETKYSDSDELEHLKYHMFRTLSKLKKNYILPHIMSKINSLHRLIKNINVPDLIKPVNQSHIPTTSVSANSIFNGISQWLDSVSPNLLKSTNIRQNHALINKLVQNLKDVRQSKQYDYEIQKNILLWLQNVLRNCNHKIFHELAEDLKFNLQNTVLKKMNLLKQDTSDYIDENILDAVVAWLQDAQFYRMCTKEERDLHEKLALLLALKLTNILQATVNEADNLNDQLMEEVQKYLKTIPMPTDFRNNSYYYKSAAELVEYLKQTIAIIKETCDDFNNIPTTYTNTNTENDFIHCNDLEKNIINDWCDNLPIYLGHSSESKEQAKKKRNNIAMRLLKKLSYINSKGLNNDINFENIFSHEIDEIFKNVPMNRELERSLSVLKSILIEKLKQAKIQTETVVPQKILHDTLTKTLQEIENTPHLEQDSLNLLKEKLADAFINLHYPTLTDDDFRDKLKDKLYNEINKICDAYLERYPFSPMDSDELRFNLYAILKKVPIPDMQQADISNKSSKLSMEKEVTLKNTTTKYSSPQFLPSTLNNEDRAYLEVIRKRVPSYKETTNSERPYKKWSPQFKDVGVLTDREETVEENVQTSKTLLPDTNSYSKEILPQVVIKEFYWDSNGSNQSLQIVVPPALTPHAIIQRKKDTNNSQNQTETNMINNSTKVEASPYLPDTSKVSNNRENKSSDATSQKNNTNQEHFTNTIVNSPKQETRNNHTVILPKESNHRQQQSEKPLPQYLKRRDTYPDRDFDNGVLERYWIQQPRTADDDRYNRRDNRQSNYLEDLVTNPDDRRMLTQRIYLTPENRNKENMCCNPNTNPNWRIGEGARRRCNHLKHCLKCCGGYCPHPSNAFFKKSF